MSKHTPGPWYVDNSRNSPGHSRPVIYAKNNRIIADSPPRVHGDFAQIETDLRLMAAAPEMLEALKLSLETMDRASPVFFGNVVDRLRETISLAEGK